MTNRPAALPASWRALTVAVVVVVLAITAVPAAATALQGQAAAP
jgi:hypothetical protein